MVELGSGVRKWRESAAIERQDEYGFCAKGEETAHFAERTRRAR